MASINPITVTVDDLLKHIVSLGVLKPGEVLLIEVPCRLSEKEIRVLRAALDEIQLRPQVILFEMCHPVPLSLEEINRRIIGLQDARDELLRLASKSAQQIPSGEWQGLPPLETARATFAEGQEEVEWKMTKKELRGWQEDMNRRIDIMTERREEMLKPLQVDLSLLSEEELEKIKKRR